MTIITLTKDNFKKEVYQEEKPILVEFYSAGCGLSRIMLTSLNEIEKENEGRLKIGKVDCDKEDALSYLFDIRQTPTFILFNNCEIVKRKEGLLTKKELQNMIDELPFPSS